VRAKRLPITLEHVLRFRLGRFMGAGRPEPFWRRSLSEILAGGEPEGGK
jgi:hypothetical protein